MNTKLSVQYQTMIMDAKTGRCVKKSPKKKNLVLDSALNSLAQSAAVGGVSDPAGCFSFVKIGSGTNPNRVPGGATTFTQVGTTLTASVGFFTAGMVGSLFKYGTDTTGAEYYITAFTSSTIVTVDTAATVAAPTAGVVWNVQQTTLQTQLYQSSTYQTATGDCGTSYLSNSMALKRTFVFPVQVASYTVNEIGWSGTTGTSVFGRALLSSSDVVGPTNFYVVVLTLTFTITPAVPTLVANFGTGINTAGNVMVEMFGYRAVSTSGISNAPANNQGNFFFSSGSVEFWTNNYTQNAAITSNGVGPALPAGRVIAATNTGWVKDGSIRGRMINTSGWNTSTSGQTCYGVGAHCGVSPFNVVFDVKFTTPQVLPVGAFVGNLVMASVYNRVLDNA